MIQPTPERGRRFPVAIAAVVAAMLGIPLAAGAQPGADVARRWRIEPAVGIWYQHDDGVSTRRQVGQLVRLQVSRQRGAASRLTASAVYHRLDDAREQRISNPAGESRTDVYDMEIISVTAGAARDVGQGSAAAVSLGFEMGGGLSRGRFDRSNGSLSGPFSYPPTTGDWEPIFFAAPSLALRHAVGPRVELTATGRVLLGVGDIGPNTIPTLAAGVAYRF
jgi:hypothetical protein